MKNKRKNPRPKVKRHRGKFHWKPKRNNAGLVWGWWFFRDKFK